MDWDKLKTFHTVALEGSFSRAGEVLNLSQSAVSRQVHALEESLSAPLFHRHARGLMLTEQGEVLFRTAREVAAKLVMTEALLGEAKDTPRGELKVTTTVAFGTSWLAPRILESLDDYPDIAVTLLVVDDRALDLSMREADVAILFAAPPQGDLVQRHLLALNNHVYAAPEYLARYGAPQVPEDLSTHRLLVYVEDIRGPVDLNWLLRIGAGERSRWRPSLKLNSLYGLMRAAESGLGLAGLPDYMASGNPRLVRTLDSVSGPVFPCYFVYPEELRNSKRIGVFRDFLFSRVSEFQRSQGNAAKSGHGVSYAPRA